MMAWWEDVSESRIIIIENADLAGNHKAELLSLCHPKSGKSSCYLYMNGNLQELHWFKQSYSSWFLGDYVCEDGGLFSATPVDPVFVLLPIFGKARLKTADNLGKFRQLDEIIFVENYPGYMQLLSIAENAMEVVCEIKEIGAMKFFRLDDTKVLSWLHCKVHQLKQSLSLLDPNYAAQDDNAIVMEAVYILGEYLEDDPWLKLLCKSLNLKIPESTHKGMHPEALLESAENFALSNSFQETKTSTAEAKKPAKIARVENNSKNIRDMFSRASTKGK